MLDGRAAAGSDRGEQVGALDAIFGTRLFDVERSHAQVAVVFEGYRDQLAQLFIHEKLAPADVRHAQVAHRGFAPPLRRDRCLRSLVIGGHRGATAEQRDDRKRNQCFIHSSIHQFTATAGASSSSGRYENTVRIST